MQPFAAILALLILTSVATNCNNPTSRSFPGLSGGEAMPDTGSRHIFNYTDLTDTDITQFKGEVEEKLHQLFSIVESGNLADIIDHVHPQHGLYVDHKVHRDLEELRHEFTNPDGYIARFYLDSERLREATGNDSQISVRDVLRSSRSVQLEFYFESPTECEVRIVLDDFPEESFRLNQPVFLRVDDSWYIYRLF